MEILVKIALDTQLHHCDIIIIADVC
jgi:hypothetical protein